MVERITMDKGNFLGYGNLEDLELIGRTLGYDVHVEKEERTPKTCRQVQFGTTTSNHGQPTIKVHPQYLEVFALWFSVRNNVHTFLFSVKAYLVALSPKV